MPGHKFIVLGMCLAGAANVLFFTGYASVQSLIGCGGQDVNDVPMMDAASRWIPNNNNSSTLSFDPEGTDCGALLRQFRADEIDVARREGDVTFQRSFVTVAYTRVEGGRAKKEGNNSKAIYVATHDKAIDNVRASIAKWQYYYETKLTEIVADTFEGKRREGKESIMLDVGANIGWFSLVSAAHGASKVYSFEPNLQNTIRYCESLSLNGWYPGDLVVPVSKGVGNVEEEKVLYEVNGGNPGSFSFVQQPGKKAVGNMIITTLDAFAERHGWFRTKPSIGFFKLDVEHFEKEVMEGAQRLLKSGMIEQIAMELQPNHSTEAKQRICEILFDAGYELVLHGGYMGPSEPVRANYTDPLELVKDLEKNLYKENVLWRLKR